ncbi:bifunctional oligoribonuclease/PAP phosphatase NrnA [Neolewinella lacunae]|uniref:Bifunctional oligoribonuclease/PAP phosphatase NrnA n=1 Tax=Neolewinella lacunae TaxID=1517758 RepID=A0A923PLT8_9BACT|nr:bifunctional oligoribonuclease/PAP phosphatase NrnA [Neolewinella lacunae]MBC6993558.1 bifunctional oligoribonuclease/PAP phosphatase NrnA [Neolewinella lacunae]MDN3636166.1 bifunctional oligoribonuclease/PAP phosphatase NrnA [Neolewinella lacunae]
MEPSIEEVKALLSRPKDVVIFSHRNPDGDAVGSSLGLSHYLASQGHQVKVVLPSDYPDFLSFLPKVSDIIIYDDDTEAARSAIDRADLFFILDFNSFDRIDKVGEGLDKDQRPRIMIDHHLYPEPVADFMFSDPSASSTCEMVYTFISDLGHAGWVTKDIADCLYTGIVTDTGGFRYATSPALFRTVAKLLEAGTDDYKIQDNIWNTATEKQLRILGHCLANQMEILPEVRTGIVWLTKQDYERFDIQRGDTEGIVNYILRMPGLMIAAFIHEQPTIVKISIRSKGEMDVQQICKAHFRGGGHRNAAGGASFAPLGATINKFKKLLPDYATEIDRAYYQFNNQ